MARITRINANVARQILHSVVAKAGQNTKGVSKTTFKKDILGKAEGQHLGILRGDRETVTRNELKHSFRELKEEILKHPEKFAPNRRALEKMGIHAYVGSKLHDDFDSEESLNKVDRYAVGEQKELDSSKKPMKSPEQEARERRIAAARRGMNLYQTQKERAEIESGKKTITPTSITTGQAEKSATSATSHEGAGTIGGATRYAGSEAAKTSVPVPGQHASPPAQSRGAVPIVGGVISHAHDGRDRDAYAVGPTLVGARDARGAAPDSAQPGGGSEAETNTPTPGLKTEATDIRSAPKADESSDDELPSTEDIDRDLPLAA